ncbi:MAG: TolC family protein [Verrucomicrobia bacterium]|nr:TolC family protein [Verrucomicrobiota bacterium]
MFFSFGIAFFLAVAFPAASSKASQNPPIAHGGGHDAYDYILKGLANNFDMRIERMSVANAEDRVTIALGEFAPRATAQGRFSSSERSQNQQEFLAGSQIARIFEEEVASLRVGLEGRLYYGTQVAFSTSTNRLENSLNRQSLSSLFSPEFQSVSQITVTQPLLRGRGREANLAGVEVARAEVLGAEFQLRSTVEETIAQILIAYAEAQFGAENLAVKQAAVQLADDLIQENRRRLEEGLMSPIDVTQAEARRAEAQEEVVAARNFLRERKNRLLELTGRDYNFGEEVRLGDGVGDLLEPPTQGRVEIARELLESNGIYRAALARAEAEGARVLFAENQALPQLDLELSLGYNGLGGDFSESFSDFGRNKEPDWSVGLLFSVPLNRDAERARLREARRTKEQALLTAKQVETQLLVLLDNSLGEIESAQERIAIVQESVELAEDALRAEERRLASGLTTSYNVLNQQRELSFARTRALAAEVELFRALTQIYVVAGSLSDTLQLDVTFAAN